MIRKILFATDLGAYTHHALVHVESLARHYDAQITLVHAVPPVSDFAGAVVRSRCSESVKQEVLAAGNIRGLLDAIRDDVFDIIAADQELETNILPCLKDILVLQGKPAGVILDEADRLKADLIVIGSHGPDAIDSHLLGSVASKILQLAKVPVFMVPMMQSFGDQSYPGLYHERPL